MYVFLLEFFFLNIDATFAFIPATGEFPSCHNHSKMIKRSLTKTSAISASVDASHLVPCPELLEFSLT